MSSDRLKKVYNSAAWRRLREQKLVECGYRCTWLEDGRHRCTVVDKRAGGTQSLTLHHIDPHGGEAWNNTTMLCRRHHGMVDGPRARRKTWNR